MQNEVIRDKAAQSDSEKEIGVDFERAMYSGQRMSEKQTWVQIKENILS